MTLGIDIDGVLADFTSLTRSLSETDEPISTGAVYLQILDDPSIWVDIPPYPEITPDLTRMLCEFDRVYFVTRRFGTRCQSHTSWWLSQTLGVHSPSVLIAPTDHAKGALATHLAIDAFIDDQPPVLMSMRQQSPSTRRYLVDRPWNVDAPPEVGTRVTSMVDALTLLASTCMSYRQPDTLPSDPASDTTTSDQP